jgi:hypothetical protein
VNVFLPYEYFQTFSGPESTKRGWKRRRTPRPVSCRRRAAASRISPREILSRFFVVNETHRPYLASRGMKIGFER